MTNPAPTPSEPAPSAQAPASGAQAPASGAAQAPASGAGQTPAPATPTPTAAPIKLAADVAKAIQAALAAEQVAVWAYDLVAAYDPGDSDLIATIKAGHLARLEATAALLISGGSTAPNSAPAYSVPTPVKDVPSARALSTAVETDCAYAWRGVIGTTDNTTLRSVALAGLSDSAVWLTDLKLAAKTSPATVPFPGQA